MIKYLVGVAIVAVLIGGVWYAMKNKEPQNPAQASYVIHGQMVGYFSSAQGYSVAPTDAGNYPGVVLVHEWWGLNDQIKTQAEILANRGYRVLAVDLFNGKVATTPAEAQKQVAALDQAKALENLKAAEKYVRDQGSKKVAALGWCFGGGQALQLSLAPGEKLSATVIYYGTPLVTDANQLKNIKWPVLGIFGDKDQAIPLDQINQLKSALSANNIQNQIEIYPGVGHAFANPTNLSGTYAPTEAAAAWNKTLVFLAEHLK